MKKRNQLLFLSVPSGANKMVNFTLELLKEKKKRKKIQFIKGLYAEQIVFPTRLTIR